MQIYSKDPILAELKKGKKTVDGGRSFVVKTKVDTLNHGQFKADSTFDVSKKQIHDKVEYSVKGAWASMTLDHFDETMNRGKAQIINMLAEKAEDLEEAMRQEKLNGLYDAPTADGYQGIQLIVDDNNTLAGINRSTAGFDYWKSIVREDTSGTTPIVLTYDILRKFFVDVTDGGKDGRSLIFVGDFTTVSKIENILASRNQINSRDNEVANLGFEDFKLFNRKVYSSSELEAQAKATGKGVLYALNFDYLTEYALAGSDHHLTKFKEDRDTALKSQQLICMGNFVATKPRRLGVIRDISLA